MSSPRRNQSGFTLVELLIVVIHPRHPGRGRDPAVQHGGAESKEAALASNLATIRQAVELYKVQHNDVFPDAAIVVKLTTQTLADGTPGNKYGPYIREQLPSNPIDGSSAVATAAAMPGAPTAAGRLDLRDRQRRVPRERCGHGAPAAPRTSAVSRS